MTEPTPDQEAISTARALTAVLGGVQGELKAVNERQDKAERFSHRSRVIIVITVISLLIDLTVTGLFINNNVRLDHATAALHATTMELQHTRATVAEVHQTLLAGCLAGNQNKHGQVLIWKKLASLTPPAASTPPAVAAQQEAKVQKFLAFVEQVDGPRNCAAAYKLPGGKP